MRRREARPQAHPVGDALDEPARAAAPAVVLEAVHELVDQDALDLVGARRVRVGALGGFFDGIYVAEGEVWFFILVTQIGT